MRPTSKTPVAPEQLGYSEPPDGGALGSLPPPSVKTASFHPESVRAFFSYVSEFNLPRYKGTSIPPLSEVEAPLSASPGAERAALGKRTRRRLVVAASLAGLAASVGAATMLARWAEHGERVSSSVSGSPSLKHSDDGDPVRWYGGPLRVTLSPSLDTLGPFAKDAARAAIATWSAGVPNLPPFAFDDSGAGVSEAKQDGVSVITVGPITDPGHEKSLAITRLYYDQVTGGVVEADITINEAYAFGDLAASAEPEATEQAEQEAAPAAAGENAPAGGVAIKTTGASAKTTSARSVSHDGSVCPVVESDPRTCDARYDLQGVLTHEIGHFAGLGDELEIEGATMFKCTATCETHKRLLTQDDLRAALALYDSSDTTKASQSCAVAGAVGGGEGAGVAGMGAGALGVFLASGLRRRRGRSLRAG